MLNLRKEEVRSWSARVSKALLMLSACVLPTMVSAEWELVWSDEFDVAGAPDPTKWGYDLGGGGWGNNERQVYTDSLENARVENGELLIQMHQTDGSRVPGYTSARLTTREHQSLLYGRVEVRAQMPSETGTWSAIWMLPTDALLSDTYWPDNGEIDIVEHVGYEEDPLFLETIGETELDNVHSTLHTNKRNHLVNTGIGERIRVADASEAYHVYALEWTPDSIEVFVDGVSHFRVDKLEDAGIPLRNRPTELWPWWPFTQRFHLILNIAVGGGWGGHFHTGIYPNSPYGSDGIDHAGVWPQTMRVDYVRFFKRADDVPEGTVVPGVIDPLEFDDEYGLLVRKSPAGAMTAHTYDSVDAGDFAEFELVAATAGTYPVVAELASATGGQTLVVSHLDVEQPDIVYSVAATGSTQVWTEQALGTLELERGRNRIRVSAESNGFRLGGIRMAPEVTGEWKGFPLNALGAADTGAWLGPVSADTAPFLFVPRIEGWIYPASMTQGQLQPGAQWVYFFSPASLDPYDAVYAPWYYSMSLARWFYAGQPLPEAGSFEGRWIFLLN